MGGGVVGGDSIPEDRTEERTKKVNEENLGVSTVFGFAGRSGGK